MTSTNTTQSASAVKKPRKSNKVHDPDHPNNERAWDAVCNNYTDEHVAFMHGYIEDSKVQYLCFAKEVGESGTPHLQCMVYYKDARPFSAVLGDLPKGFSFRKLNTTTDRLINYCLKTRDDPTQYENGVQNTQVWEYGKRPLSQKAKGKANADRYSEALAFAKVGDFDAIQRHHSELWTKYKRAYREHFAEHRPEPVDLPEYNAYWFVGETSSGKTTSACKLPHGKKDPTTKFWDTAEMYKDVIVIEEWEDDADCRPQGAFLKLWAGKVPFLAAIKGTDAIRIRPKLLIVTSNYTLQQCFGYNPKILNPLRTRFKEIHFRGEWYQDPPEIGAPWFHSVTRLPLTDPRRMELRNQETALAVGGVFIPEISPFGGPAERGARPDNICLDEDPSSPKTSPLNVPAGRYSPTELALVNQSHDDLFGDEPEDENEPSLDELLRANAVQ